jgi:hypothetical protein
MYNELADSFEGEPEGPVGNEPADEKKSEDQGGDRVQARDGKCAENGEEFEDESLQRTCLYNFRLGGERVWAEVLGVKGSLL